MISRTITLAHSSELQLPFAGCPTGEDMPKLKSMTSEQYKSPEWVKEIQLSGTFRLGGKGFCFADYAKGKVFGWRKEKSSSGYKLIELDTSKSPTLRPYPKGRSASMDRTSVGNFFTHPRSYNRESNNAWWIILCQGG